MQPRQIDCKPLTANLYALETTIGREPHRFHQVPSPDKFKGSLELGVSVRPSSDLGVLDS